MVLSLVLAMTYARVGYITKIVWGQEMPQGSFEIE